MLQNARSAKITKKLVDSLAREDARYILWDTQLKGFGVRVATSDIKTYVFRYWTTGGADRLLQISRHGVVTTKKPAKGRAAVLAEVAAGGDPQSAKVERREELTMSGLCPLYVAEGTAMKRATTLRIDRIRIDRHIAPRIGRMKISDITRADIERLMIDVGSGRIRGEATPHTRGGKHAAARTVIRLRSSALKLIEELPLIGKLLGHNHISTTRRYAHLADDPLKAAADRISERVAMTLVLGLVTDASSVPGGQPSRASGGWRNQSAGCSSYARNRANASSTYIAIRFAAMSQGCSARLRLTSQDISHYELS